MSHLENGLVASTLACLTSREGSSASHHKRGVVAKVQASHLKRRLLARVLAWLVSNVVV